MMIMKHKGRGVHWKGTHFSSPEIIKQELHLDYYQKYAINGSVTSTFACSHVQLPGSAMYIN
jgi:hypothetical protein